MGQEIISFNINSGIVEVTHIQLAFTDYFSQTLFASSPPFSSLLADKFAALQLKKVQPLIEQLYDFLQLKAHTNVPLFAAVLETEVASFP